MPYAIVSFPSVQGTADAWRIYAEAVAFLGGLGMAGDAAFDGHGGGEFGRDQRHGNTPKERDDQKIEQSHAGAAGGDHRFQAEGASGGVGEHYEDEVEEAGFVEGGLRGWLRRAQGCERNLLG